MVNPDGKLRDWLRFDLPGLFTGADGPSVMSLALDEYREAVNDPEMTLDQFKAGLRRYGFMVEQVREQYRLVLPSPPMVGPRNMQINGMR